jgi:hypothetical protein
MSYLKVDEVLAVEPGSYELEKQRHAQFAEDHLYGDWHCPGPALIAHTEVLRAIHEVPGLPRRGTPARPSSQIPVSVVPVAPDLSDEQWHPVPGSDGCYEISDQGRLWSRPRHGTLGGIIKGSTSPDGYRQVLLQIRGRATGYKIHTMVAIAFIGPRPKGMEVCHKDGNKLNNNRSNLKYDTHRNNTRERVLHGHHYQAAKTHCDSGHEFTLENTRIRSDGSRTCRTCERERLGWQGGIAPELRTHCPAGHEYTEENTHVGSAGFRKCKTCHRARAKEAGRRARAQKCAEKVADALRRRPAELSLADAAFYDLYLRWLGGEAQSVLAVECGIVQASLSRRLKRFAARLHLEAP